MPEGTTVADHNLPCFPSVWRKEKPASHKARRKDISRKVVDLAHIIPVAIKAGIEYWKMSL